MTDKIPDQNFDAYAERFQKNIYGSLKGKIRLRILLNDLGMFVKRDGESIHILDAGCGSGPCSSELARQGGHRVTLCDISGNMISRAQDVFREKKIDKAEFVQTSIQEMCAQNRPPFDLVLCHAVLEWAENPRELLNCLNRMLKPGGYLSLMFFNLNGTIFKTILRGNFYKKDNGFKFGRTKSLTPTNPLKPVTVEQWMDDLGLRTVEKSGIRIFYDHYDRTVRSTLDENEVLECEQSFSRTEPFLSMARYIHLLSRKRP